MRGCGKKKILKKKIKHFHEKRDARRARGPTSLSFALPKGTWWRWAPRWRRACVNELSPGKSRPFSWQSTVMSHVCQHTARKEVSHYYEQKIFFFFKYPKKINIVLPGWFLIYIHILIICIIHCMYITKTIYWKRNIRPNFLNQSYLIKHKYSYSVYTNIIMASAIFPTTVV